MYPKIEVQVYIERNTPCRQVVSTCALQERVGAVLGHNAVGLALLCLILVLELVAHAVIPLGEELLCLKRGNAARSCFLVLVFNRAFVYRDVELTSTGDSLAVLLI